MLRNYIVIGIYFDLTPTTFYLDPFKIGTVLSAEQKRNQLLIILIKHVLDNLFTILRIV